MHQGGRDRLLFSSRTAGRYPGQIGRQIERQVTILLLQKERKKKGRFDRELFGLWRKGGKNYWFLFFFLLCRVSRSNRLGRVPKNEYKTTSLRFWRR